MQESRRSSTLRPWIGQNLLAGKETILGRGGTDFRPVFEWVAQQAHSESILPDVLIYLTDGYGTFPERESQYPTLWILTEHGIPSVPFGVPIRLAK